MQSPIAAYVDRLTGERARLETEKERIVRRIEEIGLKIEVAMEIASEVQPSIPDLANGHADAKGIYAGMMAWDAIQKYFDNRPSVSVIKPFELHRELELGGYKSTALHPAQATYKVFKRWAKKQGWINAGNGAWRRGTVAPS